MTLPPRYTLAYYGRWLTSNAFLSWGAGQRCEDRGWITRFNSMFGHELYLTEKGTAEAERRMVEWVCSHDSNLSPHYDEERFSDDGAPVRDAIHVRRLHQQRST